MAHLNGRIARLEEVTQTLGFGVRCATCRHWPNVRYANRDWDDAGQMPNRPAACPDCGWSPPITIQYTSDWGRLDGAAADGEG